MLSSLFRQCLVQKRRHCHETVEICLVVRKSCKYLSFKKSSVFESFQPQYAGSNQAREQMFSPFQVPYHLPDQLWEVS
jgi:hypothetical protein